MQRLPGKVEQRPSHLGRRITAGERLSTRNGWERLVFVVATRESLFFLWHELDVYCKELIVKPPNEASNELLGQIEKIFRRFRINLRD